MSLARALELLDGGRVEDTLDVLLDTWRGLRNPELADVIDIVSEDATRSRKPIEGKTRKAFQEAWLDRAGENQSADVGRLLATFAQEPCTQIPERLARFEARPPDPRVARRVVEMIRTCPCTSTPNFPLWTRLFKQLQSIGDVRMRGTLEAKLAGPRDFGSFYEVLYPRLEKALAGLVDPPPLSAADAKLVTQLAERARARLAAPPAAPVASASAAKKAGERSEEELLAMIWEDPTADGPRLVYGDWLLERGNPRGELITLQFKRGSAKGLTKAEVSREKVLLREHGRQWLGAIEPVVGREGVSFERGFLSACTAAFRTKRQHEKLIADPAWSTVVEVSAAPFELCVHPVMRSLRRVMGSSQAVVARLADVERPLDLEEIRFALGEPGPELAVIARARSLPKLRRLAIDLPPNEHGEPPAVRPSDIAWLLDSRLAKQIEHLGIHAYASYAYFKEPRPDLAAWLAALQRIEGIRSLRFDVQLSWAFDLTRDGDKWALEITPRNTHSNVEMLALSLQGVRPKTFSSVKRPPKPSDGVAALLAPLTA